MNKKTEKLLVELNRKKYKIPSGANYQLRTKNAIHISPSNSLRHELAKCIAAYQLRKYGEIKFGEWLSDELKEIDEGIKLDMKEWVKEKADFITECCPKPATLMEKGALEKDRRIDLVNLKTNDWFEFETNKKVKKSKSITIYI